MSQINNLLPATGYKILPPPADYKPLRLNSSKKDMSAHAAVGQTPGFMIAQTPVREEYGIPLGPSGTEGVDGIPFIKQEDYQVRGLARTKPSEEQSDEMNITLCRSSAPRKLKNALPMRNRSILTCQCPSLRSSQYFGKLMEDKDESNLTKEEIKERQIMVLLLKIKSGTPPQRKTGMRQITDRAREFGAGPLFNQVRRSPARSEATIWEFII